MREFARKAILAAAIAGSGCLAAASADAHDGWDKWDRWDHGHHRHGHWHESDRSRTVVVERPVVVDRRPVIVDRRPVIVAPARPAPVYMAPMMPAYAPPADPSVNFNFSFPMR